MTEITRPERETITAKFPKAEIVKTRHRYYVVGADTSEPLRLLFSLRGITPPPSRRERAKALRSQHDYNAQN